MTYHIIILTSSYGLSCLCTKNFICSIPLFTSQPSSPLLDFLVVYLRIINLSCSGILIHNVYLKTSFLQLSRFGCQRLVTWRSCFRYCHCMIFFAVHLLWSYSNCKQRHGCACLYSDVARIFYLQIFVDVLPQVSQHQRLSIIVYLLRYNKKTTFAVVYSSSCCLRSSFTGTWERAEALVHCCSSFFIP